MGRGKSTRAKVQQAILRERGMELPTPAVSGRTYPKSENPDTTLTMRLLEEQYGTSIESLIRHGTLKEVAKFLGIKESTISKWRLRLGLRTRVYSD